PPPSHLTPTRPSYTYTLSLHDALPISAQERGTVGWRDGGQSVLLVACRHEPVDGIAGPAGGYRGRQRRPAGRLKGPVPAWVVLRSEEHTSELQSQSNLVCRLLLEKKKK